LRSDIVSIDLKETDFIYITMGSKGKSEWNKTYYAENCEDILYRRRAAWKASPTIKCPCGERAQYKDNTTSRNRHFKTAGHIIWVKKQKIIEIMTGKEINNSKAFAEQFIVERLERKKARTNKDIMVQLNKLTMEAINGIDNKPKPKPKAAAEPEPEEEEEPFDPSVPHVPPSADFDPLSLAIPTPPPPPEPEAPKAYLSKKPLPADFDLNKLL